MSLQEKQVQAGLSVFSCGDKDLDEFFHSDAAAYEHSLFGKTYAFVHKKSGEISSMFTISNGSVQARQMRRSLRDKVPHPKKADPQLSFGANRSPCCKQGFSGTWYRFRNLGLSKDLVFRLSQ